MSHLLNVLSAELWQESCSDYSAQIRHIYQTPEGGFPTHVCVICIVKNCNTPPPTNNNKKSQSQDHQEEQDPDQAAGTVVALCKGHLVHFQNHRQHRWVDSWGPWSCNSDIGMGVIYLKVVTFHQ